MSKQVMFTVQGEPVGKERPRVVRSGDKTWTYTPERTRAFEELVRMEYKAQCGYYFGESPVNVTILARFGIPKSATKKEREAMLAGSVIPTRNDIDNLAKGVLDSLNNYAYHDDKQVASLLVMKYYSETPSVTVTIQEYGVNGQ